MKIYQIHETGGEWEYKYDLIVGSYLNARKAEVECQKLQVEEDKRVARARKCNYCPFFDRFEKSDRYVIEKMEEYCSYYQKVGEGFCSNYEGDMDEKHFDVREVEVIE